MTDLDRLLADFDGVSLKELDQRAALLRRIDSKYALSRSELADLFGILALDHQVLEIDGRRASSYRTTYFDTSALRCFSDHVQDRVPRFKARTRLYEDSGECVFEVKIKRSEEETDKRQIDYTQRDADQLTDAARECVRAALLDVGLDVPDDLHTTLTTSFHRVTLGSRSGSHRVTCDLGVRLTAPSGKAAAMRDDLVLLETKSEDGRSPADVTLERMGLEPVSLSKYRVGVAAVGGASDAPAQPGSDLFEAL